MKMGLAVLAILSFIMCDVAFAVDWHETARFTVTSNQTTDYFTVDYVEWRIKWSYIIDNPDHPQYTGFYCGVKEKDDSSTVTSIYQSSDAAREGISYVHGLNGTFYFEISLANIQGFTIIVEEDRASIPEYPVAFIVFLFVSVLAFSLKKPHQKLG